MFFNWLLFIVSVVVAYVGISWFGQISGGSSTSALGAFFSAVKPVPLIIITVANMFFALGLYYGFGLTRFAIPATLALGVITSFIYSIIVLGAEITLMKVVGAAVIIVGVAILAL